MIRILLLLASFSAAVLLFQNCEVPVDEEQKASEVPVEPLSEKPQEIEYNAFDSQGMIVRSLNLETGEVINRDNSQLLGCVSDERLVELHVIFFEAEFCKTPEPPEDVACTMIYRMPYASLIFSNSDKIHLGEQTSGCASTLLLCGEKDQQLRTLISVIIGNESVELNNCN